MRAIRLARLVWISTSVLLLASCGGGSSSGGGGGGGGSSSTLQMVSLSATSAQSLTPLTIKISGGNGDPITVSYSSASGFSAGGDVLNQTSNQVTVAVPIYVDPATKTPGAGSVSVSLV